MTLTQPAETLELDAESMRPEQLSTPALMRELNQQQRPSWILSRLMNVLETRRQERGMGWSRPWNKEGMRIFRTHIHQAAEDAAYFQPVETILSVVHPAVPESYYNFAEDLLADPERMAFSFYHTHTSPGGSQSEGLTISIGRRVKQDPTKRDRLDVIVEDSRWNGGVDGKADRLRVYFCPWNRYGADRSFFVLELNREKTPIWEGVDTLYESCVKHYHLWKEDESRQWSHWSSRYIDYFGARSFIPRGSSFV